MGRLARNSAIFRKEGDEGVMSRQLVLGEYQCSMMSPHPTNMIHTIFFNEKFHKHFTLKKVFWLDPDSFSFGAKREIFNYCPLVSFYVLFLPKL
jgi:hypothetical protein